MSAGPAAIASTRLQLHSGGLEAVKWLALAAMVVDHVNAAFYARELGTWATITGRVAFPLFALVIGVNLARTDGAARLRMLQRLLLLGAIAAFPHAAVLHPSGLLPLNVLVLFAGAVGVVSFLELGRPMLGAVVGLWVGAIAEFWWPGLALVLAAWAIARHGLTPVTLAALALALVGLSVVNGNHWAVLSLPAFLAAFLPLPVPRWRWAFYVLYPSHLWLLWALRSL